MWFLQFLWKIYSVLTIIVVGGLITCGWNFLLLPTHIFWAEWNLALLNSIFFWFFELWIIFIYAVWKIFFNHHGPDTERINSPLWILIKWYLPELILSYYKKKDISSTITQEWEVILTPDMTKLNEPRNLMNSLVQVDISDISSIIFLPKSWKWFQVKTPNIKRLAVYITTKIGKTVFEVEELRGIYNHVSKNLQSNLSKTDYNIVQGKINEFVQSGGEVKIERI